MKNLRIQISAFLILLSFFTVGCIEDEEPQGISTELIVKTWTVSENDISLGGIPIKLLYDGAGVPANLRPDWSQFRLTFNADGTYEVRNVALAGIESNGTWKINESNISQIVINPGNVTLDVGGLSFTKMEIKYTISTEGTDFGSLGATTEVRAVLTAVNP